MNKNKRHITLLVTLCLLCVFATKYGYTTNLLLEKAGKTERAEVASIDTYVYGVISDDNVATLCFGGKTDYYGKGKFTVKFNLEGYLKFFNKHAPYRKVNGGVTMDDVIIKEEHIQEGCGPSPIGGVISQKSAPKVFTNWSSLLSENNKNISMYVPKFKWIPDSMFVAMDNGTHGVILLKPEKYDKHIGCGICYVGLPFTILFDVVTSPIQIIGFFIIVIGMGH